MRSHHAVWCSACASHLADGHWILPRWANRFYFLRTGPSKQPDYLPVVPLYFLQPVHRQRNWETQKSLSSFATSSAKASHHHSFVDSPPISPALWVFETVVSIQGNCPRIAATTICGLEIENSFLRSSRPPPLAWNLHGSWS